MTYSAGSRGGLADTAGPARPEKPTDEGLEAASATPALLTLAGAAAGFLLIVIFFGIYKLAPEERIVWRLGFCTGIALILAAFGTRADARWRGAVVTGAGVVALLMFLALMQYGSEKPPPKTARVIFYSEYPALVELVGLESAGTPLPGAWVKVRTNYFFRVLESDLENDDCLTFVVSADFNNNGEIDDNEEYSAEFHHRHLAEALETNRPARFWFDQNSRAVYKNEAEFAADEPPIGAGICFEPQQVERSLLQNLGRAYKDFLINGLFVSNALAQTEVNTELLVQDLQAKSSSVRRQARRQLAEEGASTLPPLINAYISEPDVYLVKLGIVNVLGQMLKLDTVDSSQLSDAIKPILSSLTALIDDTDKTVRRTATSFLIDLDDPAILPALLGIISQPNSPEGRYNASFVITRLWPSLDQTSMDHVKTIVSRVSSELGEQTVAVLSEITADQGTLESDPTGWVYVGLFDGHAWVPNQHYFQVVGIPAVGDTITATGTVNIRTGPIRFDKELGWVNQQATGVIKPGQTIEILELLNIAEGFIWVRFSAAGISTLDAGKPYYVVVGSFSSEGNAVKLARHLRDKGFDAGVYKSTTGFFSVTMGKGDRDSAEDLRKEGVRQGTAPADSYLHDGSRFTSEIAL